MSMAEAARERMNKRIFNTPEQSKNRRNDERDDAIINSVLSDLRRRGYKVDPGVSMADRARERMNKQLLGEE